MAYKKALASLFGAMKKAIQKKKRRKTSEPAKEAPPSSSPQPLPSPASSTTCPTDPVPGVGKEQEASGAEPTPNADNAVYDPVEEIRKEYEIPDWAEPIGTLAICPKPPSGGDGAAWSTLIPVLRKPTEPTFSRDGDKDAAASEAEVKIVREWFRNLIKEPVDDECLDSYVSQVLRKRRGTNNLEFITPVPKIKGDNSSSPSEEKA